MAKTTRRQVEVEAISDDEGEVSQSRPFAPATNAAAARRAAPPTNAAARKPLAPATNAVALTADQVVATQTVDEPAPVVETTASDTPIPVTITPAAKRKPNQPAAGATNGAIVRPAPASVSGKSAAARAAVVSGQPKPRPKQQARKSGNIGLFVGAGVALVAVVLLVIAVVMNGGRQSAVLAPATPDLPTQAAATPVSQSQQIPNQGDPNSTESANYGQTPHCVGYAAKVDTEAINCDIYLGYVQSKDQAYEQQYGTMLNFNSPVGRRAKEALHSDALDELIDNEVAVLEAPKEGVTAPKTYIDQQMNDLRSKAGFSADADWEKNLQSKGTSLQEIRHDFEKAYLLDQMTKQHGTAPDHEEWLQAAHIVVADQTLANNIYQQIQAGGNFAALAQQYSTDPLTKNKGGLIGFVNPNSIDQTTGGVLKSLKDGETAKPLGTRKGWEIIQVQKRELRPVADTQSLKEQGIADFQTWVRPLWKNHTIVKNVTFLPPITPDTSKAIATYTPDPARGTPFGLSGLGAGLPTPNQTEMP